MALFKFRLPGKTAVTAADGLAEAPGQSVEVLRRRARHRLFGAVVLVFMAVVAFPLLFDSQPRPVAIDTPIVIPDRQRTAPLVPELPVPSAQAPAKPLLPAATSPVQAQASLEPGKEEVVTPSVRLAEAPQAQAVPPAAPAPKPAASARPDAAHDGKGDAQKAMALLEGKEAAADTPKLVVQVGAFTDAEKVREVRRKLEQAGLKTYTQVIDGKDGKRTTRVRVGPFDSRTEADNAAARIRRLELQASVISL
ncbi:MAG: SPOR domain-containing protein [Limnohabitans sp.]